MNGGNIEPNKLLPNGPPPGKRVNQKRVDLTRRASLMHALSTIAAAYGASRQNIHAHEKRHGIQRHQWHDPEAIFEILLAESKTSCLRSRLSNPIARGLIREALASEP